MALGDLEVFNQYTYESLTETIAQQVELFNEAAQGTIVLRQAANQGDYKDTAFWKNITGLVRRRNAYGSGSVNAKDLEHLLDTSVKVASGTPPVNMPPSQFTWIQRSPEEAGIVIGEQLAKAMLQDMLNTGILAAYAAMVQTTAILFDNTGQSPDTLTYTALQKGAAKFGDRSDAISAWVTHSTPFHNLMTSNLANSGSLFTFGTVNVKSDPFGRPFIISDTPSLIDTVANPDTYHVLGLVPGAIVIEQNNDFVQNIDTSNGDENILRTYQSEWTYNLGIKGYAWDKGGSHSPNDGAIGTSTNWDKYASDNKDGPGVIVKVDFA